MNFELLKSTARYYKENLEGVEIMCKGFEETRNEKAIYPPFRPERRQQCFHP